MSDTPHPPPGWYDDPAGAHGSRWWDGSGWTDQVRAAPPGDDPPLPPATDTPSGLPLSMSGGNRRIVLLVFVALVAGLIATGVVGLRATGPTGPTGLTRSDGRPLGEVLPGVEVPPPLDPGEVASRADAAGCVVRVDGEPLEDRDHLDAADAPPAAALYPDRPAHSGPHYGTVLPLPVGTSTVPIDERAVLHNMEHGSVVVWFDPDALSVDDRRVIDDWRDERADLGFTSNAGGAVFASPVPADLEDPPTVALRAWGVAVDCERFDPVVADGFLAERWGSHGAAPESNLSPYPEESLRVQEQA